MENQQWNQMVLTSVVVVAVDLDGGIRQWQTSVNKKKLPSSPLSTSKVGPLHHRF